MNPLKEKKNLVNQTIQDIIQCWYQSCKPHYVTEEESRLLGVEPELKYFSSKYSYRLKFSRVEDLDVTYGLSLEELEKQLVIVSSVNNKTAGFELDIFIQRLRQHYLRARSEKPWTLVGFDRFTYEDLIIFEPLLGETVFVGERENKANIVRLDFFFNPDHEEYLFQNKELLKDLIENYCLAPLRRIYAEAYRKRS